LQLNRYDENRGIVQDEIQKVRQKKKNEKDETKRWKVNPREIASLAESGKDICIKWNHQIR